MWLGIYFASYLQVGIEEERSSNLATLEKTFTSNL